jgi:AraC-like DNA-binding protein
MESPRPVPSDLCFDVKYQQIYKKQKCFQSLTIEDEMLFVLRLKPYTLKLIEVKDYIFKSQSILFGNEVFQTKSILKQMDLVYNMFFKDIELNGRVLLLISAIDQINEKKGDIDVKSLSNSLGITIRTLQRWFKEFIGFTPKEYIDIVALQSDISKIEKLKYLKMGKIPEHCTDYSHFFKLFKRYTNISPKVYYSSSLQHISALNDIF